ncbi:hypothetical protein [Acetobacter tropicalis]|uniref:hypothetical protein n=1 Tax=Acetobacter tropicalis TaxID=104102 RepID=UPI000A5B5D1A|nr:hypothetical protein [Acetobacter tropicalis]
MTFFRTAMVICSLYFSFCSVSNVYAATQSEICAKIEKADYQATAHSVKMSLLLSSKEGTKKILSIPQDTPDKKFEVEIHSDKYFLIKYSGNKLLSIGQACH